MTSREDVFLETLTTMPENYRACRTGQHQWQIVTPFRVCDTNRELGRYPRGGHQVYALREQVCTRCGRTKSEAYQITSRSRHTALRRINTSYGGPEDYPITGLGNTSDLRDLILGYLFDQDSGLSQAEPKQGRPRKDAG